MLAAGVFRGPLFQLSRRELPDALFHRARDRQIDLHTALVEHLQGPGAHSGAYHGVDRLPFQHSHGMARPVLMMPVGVLDDLIGARGAVVDGEIGRAAEVPVGRRASAVPGLSGYADLHIMSSCSTAPCRM